MQAPLFAYMDGSTMLRREFHSSLRSLLALLVVLVVQCFKGHCFRIGAATSAALSSDSDEY